MKGSISAKSILSLTFLGLITLLAIGPVASEVEIRDSEGMTLYGGSLDLNYNNIKNINEIEGALRRDNLRDPGHHEVDVSGKLDMQGNELKGVGLLDSRDGNVSIWGGLDLIGSNIHAVNELHVNALENDNDDPVIVKPTDDPGVDWGMKFKNPTSSSIGPVYDNNLHMGGAKVLETSGVGMFGTGSYSQEAAFEFGNPRSGTPPEGEIETKGTLNVGNCNGCDLAETVEKAENSTLRKGDVVSINEEGKLVRSSRKYDTDVAGVVSSNPVLLMGAEGGGADLGTNISDNTVILETGKGRKEIPLALEGLVPVKASAVNGAIEPGDKLTTSSISGYAMKAEPLIEKNGRSVYGSGIIGKAMEPLESGKGKIQMLATVE